MFHWKSIWHFDFKNIIIIKIREEHWEEHFQKMLSLMGLFVYGNAEKIHNQGQRRWGVYTSLHAKERFIWTMDQRSSAEIWK